MIIFIQYAREASFNKELAFWYHLHTADYHINQFLFIDESHVNDRNVNRNFGYALSCQRAVFRQLFGRGNRYTVTAALDMHGIVDYVILSGNVYPKFLFTFLSLACDSSKSQEYASKIARICIIIQL